MVADIGIVATAVLGVAGVIGLVVRWALLPYLREQVVKPIAETHRQVTPHDRPLDEEPTIVDRLDDVQTELRELRETGEGLAKKAERNRTLALRAGERADAAHVRLDGHVEWAREEDTRLWRAVDARHRAEDEERKPL